MVADAITYTDVAGEEVQFAHPVSDSTKILDPPPILGSTPLSVLGLVSTQIRT